VTVSSPAQVARLAAGATHSAVVTPSGHVWTWGSDGSGQLGDGFSTANRSTPLDVLSLPGAWEAAPSPTLSVAPGTYHTEQSIVVSNPIGGAADMHYTTSGAAPTLTDTTIADGASISIDRTVTLRVRAWAAGLAPSAIVTAAYTLGPEVPSIAPGTGTYSTAQAVTITSATNGAVVRFTTDGTHPTLASPE